jgi:hypothetical protein
MGGHVHHQVLYVRSMPNRWMCVPCRLHKPVRGEGEVDSWEVDGCSCKPLQCTCQLLGSQPSTLFYAEAEGTAWWRQKGTQAYLMGVAGVEESLVWASSWPPVAIRTMG